ncbi:unnamed protein product [Effrenium voratum]|nr:unnamed protein product [Effrenium voratum]
MSWRLTLALLHFIKLDAVRTLREESNAVTDFGEFPFLCSSDIVQQTCELLNENASTVVSRATVAAVLSRTDDEMNKFWTALSLPDSVGCADLCTSVIRYIKANHVLPPRSDLACYTVGRRSFCDADLRAKSLVSQGNAEEDDLPDFHDSQVARSTGNASQKVVPPSPSKVWSLLERVANLFRIYPAHAAEDNLENLESMPEDGAVSEFDVVRMARKSEKIALAFVNYAVREFNYVLTGPQLLRWFGVNDTETRRTILATLNSVADVLANAWYVYPGSMCNEERFAYALGRGADCSHADLQSDASRCATFEGHYVIFLCNSFFKHPDEQLLTLIHEASHQAVAYTDDICADADLPRDESTCERKAYGRTTCEYLASNMPDRALVNADNYCYYVQDVVRECLPSPPLPVSSRHIPVSSAGLTCPGNATKMGRHCRCPPNHHCQQDGEDGCDFGLQSSQTEFLPSCKSCDCVADEWEVVKPKKASIYKEDPRCNVPCGSEVEGKQLAENRCARCEEETNECLVMECSLGDLCKDFRCPQFSSCHVKRKGEPEPYCACRPLWRETPDGCAPPIDKDYRCCESDGKYVWFPREDQKFRWFPYPKHVCPKAAGHAWHHAEGCSHLVYGLNYP